MKNILLCNNSMGIGGVETVILSQITAFTRKGYNVYVIAGKGAYSDKVEELGGKFIEFEFHEENKIDEAKIQKIVDIIKEKQITEIHIHKYQCIPSVMPAALITRTPYFAYDHERKDSKKYYTWNYPLYKTLFPIYFMNAYKIIAITPSAAKKTQNEYNIPQEKYEIIYNGIDFELYKNDSYTKRNSIENILIVSRISEEKMKVLLYAIDLFRKILEKYSNAKLYIVGDGNQINNLKEYMEKYKLITNGQVELVGEKNNIKEYLEQADLLLGLGRCALEAIAMKVPAIITGYEGIKGLICKENINTAIEENFSGSNMQTIDNTECMEQIEKLETNREKIVEENYAIAKEKLDCYKNYINIPENVDINFNWVKLFQILEQQENLIQEGYGDIKAKYDWIQKIENENKNYNEETTKLKVKVNEEQTEIQRLKNKINLLQEELNQIYNSKRWKYMEKINEFLGKNKNKH